MVELFSVKILLRFDYYFYTFVDPLQSLSQTVILALLFPVASMDGLTKFGVSRLIGLALKLAYVVLYSLLKQERLDFWRPRPLRDPNTGQVYYIHPSSKDFGKAFGGSTLVFFITANIERFLQARLFTLSDLGFFGFLQSTVDNLFGLIVNPLSEFLSNFFNLKLAVYLNNPDRSAAEQSFSEAKAMYLRVQRYIIIVFQMICLYGCYMFLDRSSQTIFGKNYGTRVS